MEAPPFMTDCSMLIDKACGDTSQRTVQVVVKGKVIANRQFVDELIDDIKGAFTDRDGDD